MAAVVWSRKKPDLIDNIDISAGIGDNSSIYQKIGVFGRNDMVTTAYQVVSIGGIYRMPQPVDATELRVKGGGDPDDAAAGIGANEVTVVGIDAGGNLIQNILVMAGANASAATPTAFMRVLRCFVSKSGQYASDTLGGSVGDVVVENVAGTEDWFTISSIDYGMGHTQIGAFTVPKGFNAYITEFHVFIKSSQVVDVMIARRNNILQATPPYETMQLLDEVVGISGNIAIPLKVPINLFPLSDFICMAKGAGNPVISISYTAILEKTSA